MNRRRFLQALAAPLLASGAVAHEVLGPGRPGRLAPDFGARPLRAAPVLDAHAHVSSPRMTALLAERMGPSPMLAGRDIGSLVARLDRDGIARAWVLSEAYLMASDVWRLGDPGDEQARVVAENDFLAQAAARFPDRIAPFASLNPKRAYAIEELDRCVEQLGTRGLKLHCWNSLVDVRDARHRASLRAVLERAAAAGLPVVAHAGNGSVEGFGRRDIEIWAHELVLPIERLHVCFAHLGGAGGFAPPVQAVLAALVDLLGPQSPAADRVRVDLSAVLMADNTLGLPPTPPEERERMAELLEAWGLDRVFWGSDSIPGYLDLSRQAWPLGQAAWSAVCRTAGEAFVPRRAG